MKKQVMSQICHILDTVNETHELIVRSLKEQKISDAMELLNDCQEGAIALGNSIEQHVGEGINCVTLLEEYCELVYNIYNQLLNEERMNASNIYKKLNKSYIRILNSIKYDIKVKKEVVFLPYKVSMWDSLESVWRAADADPDCDAYVIPIPYYDKKMGGSVQELHYEGLEFPKDVPIVHYDSYSFENNRPDVIFIHNPYDENNFITTVHPFFYSSNLKKYTDRLVYIPYFVLQDFKWVSSEHVELVSQFAQVNAVMNADIVVVQSEIMRSCYVEALVKTAGEKTRSYWNNKILGIGSPKFDKVSGILISKFDLPMEWKNIITKVDGSKKLIVFYNTTIGALLNYSDRMLCKIEHVLEVFREKKDDVALLWRPHPLIEATIRSMRPKLWDRYKVIVDMYKEAAWGIYDDTAEINRAIAIADCYYGDVSSVVQLCNVAGMPIMIQDVDIL